MGVGDERHPGGAGAVGAGPGPRARAGVSGRDAAGARAVACPVAAGPGVVRQQGGGRPRPRRAHHRGVAQRVLRARPRRPGLRADRRPPPALDPDVQAGLKVAVQAAPAEVGIALANWNWKVVRQFIEARCGLRLSRSACLRYLHRLGFVYKRPKKRLLKADEAKRAAFVEEYAALLVAAQAIGAKIFFVDEAHFRADADLHGKWVLKGHPALVDSTSPRWGEQASDSSAVCLETGETAYMELT